MNGRTVGNLIKAMLVAVAVLTCLPIMVVAETADVKTLINKLDSEDVQVRQEAAEALGEANVTSAVRPLTKVLKKDEYWDVREAAAEALGKIGDPAAVRNLLKALENDENGNVKGAAAEALGKIGDDKAVDPLIEALDNKSDEARRGAALALGKIGDTTAVGPLIIALEDEDSRVRYNSAFALGELAITYTETSLRGTDSTVVTMNEHPRAIGTLNSAIEDENVDIIAGAYPFYIRKGEEGTEPLLERAIYIYGTEEMAADYLNCGNPQLEQAAQYWAEAQNVTLPTDRKGPKWGEYNE
ncbi:hypothetical protein GF359_06875 [candidate division WOR-3 bacterium]|uniref:HEAT repeat domain-containing protein n=1 Tax=candidate division WOR-3 bacterium TaxID=2052148 RepID=A0A9D5K9L4_UNCW3|nr:hypothetical protein [candidate division WOR-3 bacterium]MBD3364921.1 hypothetical protein [candidate division WOR-3 bacterium]